MGNEITNTVSVLNQIRWPDHSDNNRHKQLPEGTSDQNSIFDTRDMVSISVKGPGKPESDPESAFTFNKNGEDSELPNNHPPMEEQKENSSIEELKPDLTGNQKKSKEDLSDEDRKELDNMKQRDMEVRQHEQAHKAVAGVYGGAISYEYKAGPDGRRYAVGGEVSIDVSEVPNDPDATIAKAQTIKRAALAPAEPSAQDRQIAAYASRMEAEARAEKLEEARQENRGQENDIVKQDFALGEKEGNSDAMDPGSDYKGDEKQNSSLISAYNPADTEIGTVIKKTA